MTLQILLPSQITDGNGNPQAGATAAIYELGTTTLVDLFADAALTIPLPNPVVADGNGRPPQVFYAGGVDVWVDIEDSAGASLGYDLNPAPLSDGASSLAAEALLNSIKTVDGAA